MELNLETKCKELQHKYNFKLPESGYFIIHCDGRSFSKMIKNRFQKPFDHDFSDMMDETAVYAAKKIQGCVLTYVQSDEITFICAVPVESLMFFGGRLCKIQSIVASLCTAYFNMKYHEWFIKNNKEFKPEYLVQFDCKCWHVPDYTDVMEWLEFRQIDCIRNSKQMLAQYYFSHRELAGYSTNQQVELLLGKKNVNWRTEVYPGHKIGRVFWKVLTDFKTEDGTEYKRHVWEKHTDICFSNEDNMKMFESLEVIPKL